MRNADGQVTLGYLFLTAVCVLFALSRPAPREPEPGEPPAFEDEPAPAREPAAVA